MRASDLRQLIQASQADKAQAALLWLKQINNNPAQEKLRLAVRDGLNHMRANLLDKHEIRIREPHLVTGAMPLAWDYLKALGYQAEWKHESTVSILRISL